MPFNIVRSIHYLQIHWNHLDAVAKAERVSDLVRRGVSHRAMAREIGCSESLLRHIQKLAQLPDSIKADLRAKKISVRVAVARTHVAAVTSPPQAVTMGPTSKTKAAPDQLQLKYVAPAQPDAKGWAELMVKFTQTEYVSQRDACVEVIQAARFICRNSPCLLLGTRRIPFGSSTSYVIQNSRPLRRLDLFQDVSRWLAAWALRLIPARKVRVEAFAIAERMFLSPQRQAT